MIYHNEIFNECKEVSGVADDRLIFDEFGLVSFDGLDKLLHMTGGDVIATKTNIAVMIDKEVCRRTRIIRTELQNEIQSKRARGTLKMIVMVTVAMMMMIGSVWVVASSAWKDTVITKTNSNTCPQCPQFQHFQDCPMMHETVIESCPPCEQPSPENLGHQDLSGYCYMAVAAILVSRCFMVMWRNTPFGG